ncbi:MAG: primosomal replication protein, partial [Pseudomonadota bacterium]
IHATAIGEVARALERLAVGEDALFSGFLGRQRSGRGVMFHISSFEPVPVPHTSAP